MINDEITSVMVGRKDIGALQTMVGSWRSGGGDTIRKEYEQADKAANDHVVASGGIIDPG
jgi:hypothetical protein